jgi:sulfite oxidase
MITCPYHYVEPRKDWSMTRKRERSVSEFYAPDPERAEALRLGRRSFLGGAGLAAVSAIASTDLAPTAMAQGAPAAAPPAPPASAAPAAPKFLDLPGKDKGLVLLGDRPLVAETPEHLMNDDTTPVGKFFVRNNGQTAPEQNLGDRWAFTVEGEVRNKLTLSLGELKQKFKPRTYRMVMECGGNGRRRGLRGMDRRAPARCAAPGGADAGGQIHWALRRGPASIGRCQPRRDL